MGERVGQIAKVPEVKKSNSNSRVRKTERLQSMDTPVDRILFLQRTAGNQAVSRLMKSGALQAKLRIGQPGDVYEQEADRVADAVMRMPEPRVQRQVESEEEEEKLQAKSLAGQITPLVQRQPDPTEDDEDERREIQPKSNTGMAPQVTPGIAHNIHSFKGTGQPLPASERTFFEPRFGRDFSNVRVHTDNRASRTAQTINARAFTLGRDVVFGAGEYSPDASAGRKLLAHELTHVVQQGTARRNNMVRLTGRSAPIVTRAFGDNLIQGAWFDVGKIRVNVNYADVIHTPVSNYVSKIESMYISWTGAADAKDINASLTALTAHKQQWVMLGLDLLIDNTKSPDHNALDRKAAVKHLISRAPNTTTSKASPLPDMEKEVLQVSGWLQVALTAPLKKPKGKKLTAVTKEFFPPTSAGSTKTTVSHLNKAMLKTRLTPALKHFIKKLDPRGSSSVGTRSLPTLKSLGDTILGEAKSYFSPYSDSARSSVFSPVHSSFKISANIESTTSGIDANLRRAYLNNRGQIIGNRRGPKNSYFIDKDIFFDAGYNHNVTSDQSELWKIVVDVEKDATIQPIVDALIAFTGRQSGRVEKAKIWLPLTYRKSRFPTECKARWRVIKTLSHEVLHALSHPNFVSKKVGMGQIIREGFTEVLGVQLYNKRIVPKAKNKSKPAFKATMESGLGSAPCPDPPTAAIGYKPAGPAAERIRKEVKDSNFQAAYFLGAVEMVGL